MATQQIWLVSSLAAHMHRVFWRETDCTDCTRAFASITFSRPNSQVGSKKNTGSPNSVPFIGNENIWMIVLFWRHYNLIMLDIFSFIFQFLYECFLSRLTLIRTKKEESTTLQYPWGTAQSTISWKFQVILHQFLEKKRILSKESRLWRPLNRRTSCVTTTVLLLRQSILCLLRIRL